MPGSDELNETLAAVSAVAAGGAFVIETCGGVTSTTGSVVAAGFGLGRDGLGAGVVFTGRLAASVVAAAVVAGGAAAGTGFGSACGLAAEVVAASVDGAAASVVTASSPAPRQRSSQPGRPPRACSRR